MSIRIPLGYMIRTVPLRSATQRLQQTHKVWSLREAMLVPVTTWNTIVVKCLEPTSKEFENKKAKTNAKKANHFLKKAKTKGKKQTTILIKAKKANKGKPDIHLYAVGFFSFFFFSVFFRCFFYRCFFRLFCRAFPFSGDLMTETFEHVNNSWKKAKTKVKKSKQKRKNKVKQKRKNSEPIPKKKRKNMIDFVFFWRFFFFF